MASRLIVVAAHGPGWREQCVTSLGELEHLVVDTGPEGQAPGGHPTGAYLWAYRNVPADTYLFVQDSMTALADPWPWFLEQMPEDGAVAWAQFPMQWDGGDQKAWVEQAYPGVPEPAHGVFGPVFACRRTTLDLLALLELLPPVPTSRIEAQGTERAWAYAFAAAGIPVAGPLWNADQMSAPEGFGPFRKVFANRP